jgi:hypothetical protein
MVCSARSNRSASSRRATASRSSSWLTPSSFRTRIRSRCHPQRTYGARQAHGDWVAFSQDDNILAQDSLSAIWQAASSQAHQRPLFFRARMYWGQIVWYEPRLGLGNIDADCLVLPQAIARETTWGLRYEGDFDAAVAAHTLADGDVEWREELIALARPAGVWWDQSPQSGDDRTRQA